MKPLVTNKRMLIWLCMHPPEKNARFIDKLFYFLLSAAVYTIISTGLIVSVVYFTRVLMGNLDMTLQPVFQICADVGIIYAISITVSTRRRMAGIISTLEKIHVQYKEDEEFRFLVEANLKSERMWNFFYKFILLGFTISTFTLAASSVYACLIIHGEFDTHYLYYPFKAVLCWNQETPIGYFFETVYLNFVGISYLFANGTLLMLFISMSFHHYAFYRMFEHNTSKLGKKLDNRPILHHLINFHNSIKTWFLDSADFYSSIILVHLMCSMMMLTSSFFQLDQQFKDINFELGILFSAIALDVSNLFIYCYFGTSATDSFERMYHCLYESDWFNIPVHLQKYFILMIADAQQPLYFHGFNVAILNMETFVSFFKAAISYFMAFKTITA